MRIYTVAFKAVTVSAAQDLIELEGNAIPALLISCSVTNAATVLPTSQGLEIEIAILTATVTHGSGGGSGTIAKTKLGDAASSLTALVNNTTPATTSGSRVVVDEGGGTIPSTAGYQSPMLWLDKQSGPGIIAGQSLVFSLLSTVTGTVVLSGTMTFAEIF